MIWYDKHCIEVYYEHQRIAIHPRSRSGQIYTTLGEHMPLNHQQAKAAKGWNRDELLQKAAAIGIQTRQVAEKILEGHFYMEQNYKSCHGMLMLEKRYGAQRLEAACNLAVTSTRVNYTTIKNILGASMDRQVRAVIANPLPEHENIRGPRQYQ